jgi:DNA-binding CsgD family transcriptional regulator
VKEGFEHRGHYLGLAKGRQDIIDLVNAAHVELDATQLRHRVIPLVADMFRVERAIFFVVDSSLEKLDLASVVTFNIEEELGTKYARTYWLYDPVYYESLNGRKLVFKNYDILPRSEWLKLKYYLEFQQSQNINEEMIICLRNGANLYGTVNLIRGSGEPCFTYDDLVKAKMVAPSIALAVQNALLFSRMKHENHVLSDVVELFPRGIIILDRELRPIYCNSKGKELCLSLSGLDLEGTNEITVESLSIPSNVLRLCVGLKERRERAVGFFCEKNADNGNGRRLRIDCSILWQYEQRARLPYFLISMKELFDACAGDEYFAENGYSLTNREKDIVRCITEGLSNKEIAQKLHISPLTVDSHLKKIFEKTGVRNRTELATKL